MTSFNLFLNYMHCHQGINGQFSIPTNKLPIFRQIITGANPAFQYIDFNLGESYEEGFCAEDAITFKKLSINVKKSILTDGLSDGHDLNWHDCGREMTAEEWHRSLEVMEGGNQDAILLGTYRLMDIASLFFCGRV